MNADYRKRLVDFVSRLAGVARPLLISHAKPDGDALGSLLGLRELLAGRGVEPVPLVFDELPHRYAWLDGSRCLRRLDHDISKNDLNQFDSVIVVDTCTYSQLEPVADWLRSSALPKYVIDHHQTRDDLADSCLIDEPAAAACLILHDLATTCGWSISLAAARSLFVGIATDTGWFRHSNTDARALSAAADLVNRGVMPNEIFDRIYQSDRAPRVKLLGKAIESLDLHENGKLAVMVLPSRVFAEVGAQPSDTEDIVNEPMRIETVVVSLLLVEHAGVIRANLRSRAPTKPGDADIDVSAVAASLGGGGHRRAAGVRLRASLDLARTQVVAAVGRAMAV